MESPVIYEWYMIRETYTVEQIKNNGSWISTPSTSNSSNTSSEFQYVDQTPSRPGVCIQMDHVLGNDTV